MSNQTPLFMAEVSTIGSVFMNNAALGRAADIINADDFLDPRHRKIWSYCLILESQGTIIDAVTMASYVEKGGGKDALDYMISLTMSVATSVNVEHHAKVIAKAATLRRLSAVGDELKAIARDYADEDLADSLLKADLALSAVLEGTAPGEVVMTQSEAAIALNDQMRKAYHGDGPKLTPFGPNLQALTDMIGGGMDPTCELVAIGACSGLGKTALGDQMAGEMGRLGLGTVLYFSVEVGPLKLEARKVSRFMSVPSHKLRDPQSFTSSQVDMASHKMKLDRLLKEGVTVYHRAGMDPGYIARKVRTACRRGKVAAVFIDYWQALRPGPGESFGGNKEAELSYIAHRLKAIQVENKVPVVVLAQLNRGPWGRPGHEPMTDDLRGSSTLEHWASCIILLHRPAFFDPSLAEPDGTQPALLYVRKNREGPSGVIHLLHQPNCGRFWSQAKGWNPNGDAP